MARNDCPLCLEELSTGDEAFPLLCPTEHCDFNYCSKCIQHFLEAAAADYSEASDGSKQLKVHVQCPKCRSKYKSEKYPEDVIVSDTLLLRLAVSLQSLMAGQATDDSTLSACQLRRKRDFLQKTSFERLEDAHRRYVAYLKENGKEESDDDSMLLLDLWKSHLEPTNATLSTVHSSGSDDASSEPKEMAWYDPTLFQGLDELLSEEEAYFLTSLLTSGKTESLLQAAIILNGVLDVTATRTANRQQLSQQHQQQKITMNPRTVTKLRKRFPLPTRMPRSVRLEDVSSVQFDPKQKGLVIGRVKGLAGRLGIRKGDVVTHVNSEPVEDEESYNLAIQHVPYDGVWLAVNSDEETAKNLCDRSKKIRPHLPK